MADGAIGHGRRKAGEAGNRATLRRKDEHLDIVLAGGVGAEAVGTGLDAVRFEHVALPELALAEVDLSTRLLGRVIAAPLLISSMTGGPSRAGTINRTIAEAAAATGIAFAVGSQRVALESSGHSAAAGLDRQLREIAPGVPLLANLGGAQIAGAAGPDLARRAVDAIAADALIVHLNPLQEAVQAEGDTDWRGVLAGIERVVRALPVPVVVKEVGAGISGALAVRLTEAGVTVIDVAGVGGTSWAKVEAERAGSPESRAVAEAFRDWGIPTADAIVDVRRACPTATVIASGGVRNGLDVARAIRLGADVAGFAAGVLPAAMAGTEALVRHIGVVREQLRVACFCTASRDLAALRRARLIQSASGRL